jgi:hypothetical protein
MAVAEGRVVANEAKIRKHSLFMLLEQPTSHGEPVFVVRAGVSSPKALFTEEGLSHEDVVLFFSVMKERVAVCAVLSAVCASAISHLLFVYL